MVCAWWIVTCVCMSAVCVWKYSLEVMMLPLYPFLVEWQWHVNCTHNPAVLNSIDKSFRIYFVLERDNRTQCDRIMRSAPISSTTMCHPFDVIYSYFSFFFFVLVFFSPQFSTLFYTADRSFVFFLSIEIENLIIIFNFLFLLFFVACVCVVADD